MDTDIRNIKPAATRIATVKSVFTIVFVFKVDIEG